MVFKIPAMPIKRGDMRFYGDDESVIRQTNEEMVELLKLILDKLNSIEQSLKK